MIVSSKKFKVSALLLTSVLSTTALLSGCGGSASTGGSSAPKDLNSSASKDANNASSGKSTAKVIRLGDVVADDNPETTSEKYFSKRLGELTNGKYTIQVYSNSVLGPHTSMNKQVADGTLEMTVSASADLAQFDKKLSILSLPYLFDSKEKLFKAEDGKLGEAYSKVAEKYGLKILGFFDSGSRNIYDKSGPIKTPDDIAKMHLRLRTIPNPVMNDTVNAMGAQAVPLNTNEIYNGIQQGVVDGAENSITFYLTEKHNEIASYFNMTQHFFSIDPLIVSLKWFNSLSPEDQKAVEQAAKDTVKFEREQWAKVEEDNMKKAESEGVKINKDVDITAFQKKVIPVWEKYKGDFGDLYQILKDSQ